MSAQIDHTATQMTQGTQGASRSPIAALAADLPVGIAAGEAASLAPNMTPNSRRPFIPGYQGVLLRRDLKGRIKDIIATMRCAGDSHVERCLVSALVEHSLATLNMERIVHMLDDALQKDLDLTSPSRQGNQERP